MLQNPRMLLNFFKRQSLLWIEYKKLDVMLAIL